jgi:2'-5' RNA ligase
MTLRSVDGGKAGKSESVVKRLFFAVELSNSVKAAAYSLVGATGLSPDQVRWIHRENLHLTLKFLGDVNTEVVPAIIAAAQQVFTAAEPLRFEVVGMGVFPNHEQPRVVWLGVEGEVDSLATVVDHLGDALNPFGLKKEERHYTPHITIGRVRSSGGRGRLLRLVREAHSVNFGELHIRSVSLYESRLRPGGSIYTKLHTFRFGQGSR